MNLLGYSETGLAKKLGVNRSTVHRWVRVNNPTKVSNDNILRFKARLKGINPTIDKAIDLIIREIENEYRGDES